MWRAFKQILAGCLLTAILTIVLFSGQASSADGFLWLRTISYEVQTLCVDSWMQWAVIACLVTYLVSFLFVQRRISSVGPWCRWSNAELWLCGLTMLALLRFVFDHETAANATRLLILLAGIALGKGAALLVQWPGATFHSHSPSGVERDGSGRVQGIIFVLLLLLAAASWHPAMAMEFQYRGQPRWRGLWDNPNLFGLFMGVGISLALGLVISRWKMEGGKSEMGDRSWKLGVGKYAALILCFFAPILMVRGLLHSYSRGAWLATFCGLAFLAVQVVKNSHFQQIRTIRWIRPLGVSLIAIACAIAGLVFWQFQQPQHLVTRRILSVGNMNDFSWRNRVAAWEGALQITAEHPWFGAGWNHLEPLYEHYYLSPKLTESAAMAMNDYLMLGATLGIPALYCFGMYIWLCLGDGSWKSEVGTHVLKSNLLSMTCRAGAIVLLVGFWFDGGLFKLPTAATFWIFLELGSVGSAQPKVAPASA